MTGLFPLNEAIAWTSIFPYMYAMVESFSSAPDDETTNSNTATYAGIMVSIFTFGEFVMAPQWARISDKIGRKPTLLIGSLRAMISALAFGFSISLPTAIATRLLAGLANPNLGVVKTFVGELVDKEHQGKMYYPDVRKTFRISESRSATAISSLPMVWEFLGIICSSWTSCVRSVIGVSLMGVYSIRRVLVEKI